MGHAALTNERNNGLSDGASDGLSDFAAASDGLSDGLSDETAPRQAFEEGDHEPFEFVAIRITYAMRKRFDAWYRSQHPGLEGRQLPKREPLYDDVFSLGMDAIEEMLPPVELSLKDKLEAAKLARTAAR